jgi:predicted peptidase
MRPVLPAALLAVLCSAAPLGAAETQTVQSFERTITRTLSYRYLLHLPTGYDPAGARVWPLLVFLHGSGERGTDPWLVAKHGPPKLLRADSPAPANETPAAAARRAEATRQLATQFIVVSPQCPPDAWWDDDAVLALVDAVTAQHKVDVRRTYLTGLSLGGFGTWSAGIKHPGRFAALAPICGGGEVATVRRVAHAHPAELRSLGVWVFHGAKDPAVPLAESERMVDALKQAAVTDLQFTVYPEAKHDSWTESYANPELYAWLLRHQR